MTLRLALFAAIQLGHARGLAVHQAVTGGGREQRRGNHDQGIIGALDDDAMSAPRGSDPSEGKVTPADFSDDLDTYRLVIPELKLAFCYIPKVGCKQFNFLFNDANRLVTNLSFGPSSELGMGVDWKEVTRENGWKFAFFTRDPLERYLSAWGSKCMIDADGVLEGDGRDCGQKVVSRTVTKNRAIHMFEEHALFDGANGTLFRNRHWAPQTAILERCDLGIDLCDADFHGHLSANGSVNKQVRKMLHMAGSNRSKELADRHFPAGDIAGHRSVFRGEDFYANTSVAEAVRSLYREDFDMLASLPVDPSAGVEHSPVRGRCS